MLISGESPWTLAEIARRLDVNYHTVCRWRAGTHSPLRVLKRKLFGLTPRSKAA